ncbi:MAG: glutaredoxin family protein [Nitrospiria bacterium]
MENELIYLYQAEWCPYCANVRSKLTDLEIDYLTIKVPRAKADRDDLFQVSGQRGIPTLVHGDVLIADDDEAINAYLDTLDAEAQKAVVIPREAVGS